MRFETHRVGEYVVRLLQYAASVQQVLVDGGDIIECRLVTGDLVSVHLIESHLELYEAEQTLRANGERNVATLFLFWRDLLLPDDGQRFQMDVWLAAWIELYGGKIYGYDIDGPDIYIFPVHIEADKTGWVARFGRTVDPARLVVRQVYAVGMLPGVWRVAAFDGDSAEPSVRVPHTIEDFYAVLELETGATRAQVKRAYRRLARQLHPDINTAGDATARMQALNEAYHALLTHLDAAGTET